MQNGRVPWVQVCGTDNVADSEETVLPLWAQITIAIGRTQMIPILNIDVSASLARERDIVNIKQRIQTAAEDAELNLNGINRSNRNPCVVPLKPHHSIVYLCGVEPSTNVPTDIPVIYTPTKTSPAGLSYAFDKLSSNGYIVLHEAEARALLQELDPTSRSRELTGRELVRALISNPFLRCLRGIIVTYGSDALHGCVASALVMVTEEEGEFEKRYEFDIAPAIIGPGEKIVTEGTFPAFVGKFISSQSIDANCTASQFSFQLMQACVAAACTALVQRASPWNLEECIPTLEQIRYNIERYLESQRMLRDDEEETFSDWSPPPRPRDSWPAPVGCA